LRFSPDGVGWKEEAEMKREEKLTKAEMRRLDEIAEVIVDAMIRLKFTDAQFRKVIEQIEG
jgi:hypothetical protein